MMVARSRGADRSDWARGLGGLPCTAQPALLARLTQLEEARVRLARQLGLQLVTVTTTTTGVSTHVALVSLPPAPRVRPRDQRHFEPMPTAWARIPIEPRFKWEDL